MIFALSKSSFAEKGLENTAFFAISDARTRKCVMYRHVASALLRMGCAVHVVHWRDGYCRRHGQNCGISCGRPEGALLDEPTVAHDRSELSKIEPFAGSPSEQRLAWRAFLRGTYSASFAHTKQDRGVRAKADETHRGLFYNSILTYM